MPHLTRTTRKAPALTGPSDSPGPLPPGGGGPRSDTRGRAWNRHSGNGVGPRAGTRVAALLYSLMESAKLAGVEPRAYLGEAARQAIRNPGAVTLARDFK
ncbi:MAG: transposase domain-containing protein [Planctomycetota bacterium]